MNSKSKYQDISNINIESIQPLMTPNMLKHEIPVDDNTLEKILKYRADIINVLNGKDNRMLLVVGPCSVHDPKAIIDYAQRLKQLSDQVQQNILVVMRVYFEKPRTTLGWKGLINDPELNNSFDINQGLVLARQILYKINQIGLPVATEFLDAIIPQYISDLISWAAIGARTSESQIHRSLSSGLSIPVGIKNSTTGYTKTAVDAMLAAYHENQFLSVNDDGMASIVKTKGNPNLQLVLRGGTVTGPNYSQQYILKALSEIRKIHLRPNIMVDCSHGNSHKDYTNQTLVLDEVIAQLSCEYGNYINGIMIESFIEEGSQPLTADLSKLEYGKSITDSCISWQETEKVVLNLADNLSRLKREKV